MAVAADLRRRIGDAEWLAGEQLPSVRELANQYDVSHATTARAIKTLQAEGLVQIVPSWGTFVV